MLSKLSVKKPYTVIVGIILVIVLGYISFQHMTTDLLPSMNLPYVVVYTPYPGATPEQVEGEITRPMEAAFATLTDVKKITSQSRDNVSVVIIQFNDGANMDTALIEISSQLDQLEGGFADEVGSPVALKLNPDMLPVAILSVTRDDMDILELSDYVTDELVPGFESLNGVASANASGVITQEVDITIEQSRIDVLNSAILEEIDSDLAEVERKLNKAQGQVSEGRRKLANAKAQAYGQIHAALDAIDKGEAQLQPAIDEMKQKRNELAAQREGVARNIEAMEQMMNLSDEDKAAIRQSAGQLAALRQRRADLERQLAEGSGEQNPEIAARLADAQAERDALAAERDAQKAYINDLHLMDPDSLQADIDEIQAKIVENHAKRDGAQAELDELVRRRDEAKARVEQLSAQIGASGSTTDAPTDAPSSTPDAETTDAPSDTTNPPEADSTDAPGDGTTNAPADDATDKPDTDPTDEPAGNATDNPTGDPTDKPASSATDKPNTDPTDRPAGDTTDKPANSATDKPAAGSETSGSSAGDSGSDALTLCSLTGARAEGIDPALAAQLSDAQAELDDLNAQVKAKSAEVDGLNREGAALASSLTAKQDALDALQNDNENIEGRVAAAQERIDALDQRIDALDQEIESLAGQLASGGDNESLLNQLAQVDQQIQMLEASGVEQAAAMLDDDKVLAAQYAQAQEGLAQLDAGIELIDDNIAKLEQGIIPGGLIEGIDEDTKLSEAREKLQAAEGMAADGFAKAEDALDKADAEISKARKEFNEKREEAFEKAGLDGVITVQMVSGIIGAQNFSMPAGYVKDTDSDQVLVRVGDKFASLDDLKRMKLFSLGLDSIDEVRLLDVARVEITDNRDEVFTKLDGQDGILLSLEKQSTYSTADVADTIIARALALQAADPNLHIVDLMNQGEYIDIVVDSVLNNLITGGALAILILLLFLLDWRLTLTVAFSIPISVVIAFVCMYFTGITLNVLSLSGLALGIGMLVDNSIVSIENVYRLHGEEGVPLLKACVDGVKSVSGALFASTLTTVCVFLPIVFVQGMARDLFADMGLTIAYSLLASLLVAMTVVPMMTSFLMRKSKPKQHRLFGRIQAAYTGLLRGALRVKPLVLLAAVALLAFSAMQVSRMGISFMPEVNSRQMSANYVPDPEMSTADQKAQAMAIMGDMLEIEGIQSIGLMDGSGTMLSSGGGYSYYIIVDESAGVKNADIAAQIDQIGEKHSADLTAQASTMDISMLTGSGISVEITGDDIDTLQAVAVDVAEIARGTEGVTDVNDGLEDAVPEMRIVVDKEKAIDHGLTTGQVYQFIAQKLMGKVEVGKVTLNGKEMEIQLIEGRNSNLTPRDIQDLEIEVEGEEETKMVRIGDISEIRDAQSLSTIYRASQRRMVTVSFAIQDGYSANLVSDDFEARLRDYDAPAGCRIELAGENETVMGIMEDLVWMILVAVLLIFLIMVAQFQSFKSPIIVMFTIPLAFTGGMLALLLTKMDLSIVAMLGFLVLSGVVVNNGIVFIDCVNQLRISGMDKKAALIEAGRQRLRPILMTALTTILGISTMALGHGTGAEMMQPMAVVSIGGLTYATLMTLFVVPVLYDLFNGKRMKAREIQMIREAAGMNGDEVLYGDAATDTDVPVDRPNSASPAEMPAERAGSATPAAGNTEAPLAPDPPAPGDAQAAEAASAPVPDVPEPFAPDDGAPLTAQALFADDAPPTEAASPTSDIPPTPVFAPRAGRVHRPRPDARPIRVMLGQKKKR